jgi:hypothetical protein
VKNLTIVLDNRPGTLAGACEAIAMAGVNIEGMCCFASQGIAMLYLAVEDGASARRAVEGIQLKVSEEREVVVMPVEDHLGAAGRILRRIAEAGINIELAYMASGPRLVVGVDQPDRLRAIY